MGLIKSRGNMYNWATYTWNPVGGRCQYKCSYCYVQTGMAKYSNKYKSNIRLIERELETPLGRDRVIFVCSCIDLFGDFVRFNDIEAVLAHCKEFPSNTYLFQSKNPFRFLSLNNELFPPNTILCTTIETNRDISKFSKAPPCVERALAMSLIRKITKCKKSITIEPIMDFDLEPMVKLIKEAKPDFISIGADSKGCGLPEPSREKVNALIERLTQIAKIERKTNLERLVKDDT